MSPFNAWHQAWVPVRRTDDTEVAMSLRDLFLHAHDLAGLGSGLTPLDLDSLFRFLPAVGAVIARGDRATLTKAGRFSPDAVSAFEAAHAERFDLAGPRPFLQRWDKTQDDLAALVPDGGEICAVRGVYPLEQLLPHEPGDSSSQWLVRRDRRNLHDWPAVTLALTTAWFQTKNGNSKDPWGGGHQKGSAGTWHVNPMALFLIEPGDLARSIAANIPARWLADEDLPMFLDHEGMPDNFADDPGSLYRFTYARTLPLLCLDDRRPCGFVLGQTPYPAPILAGSSAATAEKESLGLVHERDHTRLYVKKAGKDAGNPTLAPRGSFGGRLTSTEGFVRWFRADSGITGADGAFARWLSTRRVHNPGAKMPSWQVGVYSETTDGKGTRTWCDWSVLPGPTAGGDLDLLNRLTVLAAFIDHCKKAMFHPMREAAGESGSRAVPAQLDAATSAFYTQVEGIVAKLRNSPDTDLAELAGQIRDIAVDTFHASTAPLVTPQTLPRVSSARAAFGRSVVGAYTRLLEGPTPAEKKDDDE